MKKRVLSFLMVALFLISSVRVNAKIMDIDAISDSHTVVAIDCNEVYDAYYEAAYFSGYSFSDALDIAEAAYNLCTALEIIGSYLN